MTGPGVEADLEVLARGEAAPEGEVPTEGGREAVEGVPREGADPGFKALIQIII